MRDTRTFARFTQVMPLDSLEGASADVLRGIAFPDPIPLAANRPMRLDDEAALWIVTGGEVDLFHVRASSDVYLSNRRYVGTLRAGEVVLGARPTEDGEDGVLVAVGFGGAGLQRVERAAIDEADGDEARIARAVARGVGETIGRAMYRAGRATARPVSASDVRLQLAPGESITSGGDVLWIRVAQGMMALGGDIAITRHNMVVPLARGAWMTAGHDGATITVLDTFAAFASKQVDASLGYAWDLFLGWLTIRAAGESAVDRARLARKTVGERVRLAGALASLSSLLQQRGDAPPAPAVDAGLLDACALVGRAAGVAFHAPTADEAPLTAEAGADPWATSIQRLCRTARVRHRRVTLRPRWWERDAGPLLGFRGIDRAPVALLVRPDGGYDLHDPARGERRPVDAALASNIASQAYVFYQPAPPGAVTARTVASLLWRDAGMDLRRLAGLIIAGATLGLALPIVIGVMFNQVIPSASSTNALTLFAALVAVALAVAAVEVARALTLLRLETRGTGLLQALVIDRLLSLPPQFFRRYSVGDLAQRAEAVNAARQLLTGVAITSVFGAALVLTNLALMWFTSARLALVAVGVLVTAGAVTAVAAFATLPYERQRQALSGRIGTLVFELLGGIGKLHVAAAESRMFAVWSEQFRALKVATFRAGLAAAVLTTFNAVLPLLATALLFAVTGSLLTGPTPLATGSFVAFHAAFGSALATGIGVSVTLVSVLAVVPLVERAQPILTTLPEVDDAKPDIGAISGRIEVAQVTFGYIPGTAPIIEDLSFELRAGEYVAVVGPSGSGKSTLLRLLLGFERPDRGAVYYDGHDLASVDVAGIRRQCAVVLQHSKLLAGDLFTNIVGATTLTLEDAWRAAELAGLADDIEAMPMGMHTVISEGGSTLSGGQRQRLLIARALVRNPRVVFFDEATSALDNRSQEIVTRSLEGMEATRLVIAHRLTTVRRADRILVMAAGRLVQQGRYDDLVEVDGPFRELAKRQLL